MQYNNLVGINLHPAHVKVIWMLFQKLVNVCRASYSENVDLVLIPPCAIREIGEY